MAPRERKREKKILVSDVIEHCISFVVKGKVVETARTHEQTIKKKKNCLPLRVILRSWPDEKTTSAAGVGPSLRSLR